jgi:hypothetical protein
MNMNSITTRVFTRLADVKTYFNWGSATKDNGSIMDLVMYIFNFISAGVVLVIIIGIIIGGVQYSLATGDQGKVKNAIAWIRNCIIALLLYVAFFVISNLLVPGGFFNASK